MMSSSSESIEALCRARAHHRPGGRFCNPWAPHDHWRMIAEWVRWQLDRLWSWPSSPVTGAAGAPVDLEELEREAGDYLVWLGHSTVFGRLGGAHLLTDPVFGEIWGGLERHSPCPVSPAELPGVDVLLLSHDHYDHLDVPSLEAVHRRFHPTLVCGLGHRRLLERRGVGPVVELDWWRRAEVAGLELRCLPAQHWSRRMALDTDRRLWCGFLLEGAGRRLCFFGDSGFFRGFAEIGRVFGPFDVALLPAAPARPRRVMAPQHMDPTEAVRAAVELGARRLLPIHWGTFNFGEEPLDQASSMLVEARGALSAELELPAELVVGATVRLEPAAHSG